MSKPRILPLVGTIFNQECVLIERVSSSWPGRVQQPHVAITQVNVKPASASTPADVLWPAKSVVSNRVVNPTSAPDAEGQGVVGTEMRREGRAAR
jgi:nitrogen fixation protein FixH